LAFKEEIRANVGETETQDGDIFHAREAENACSLVYIKVVEESLTTNTVTLAA
jgi:hypothetical protein